MPLASTILKFGISVRRDQGLESIYVSRTSEPVVRDGVLRRASIDLDISVGDIDGGG